MPLALIRALFLNFQEFLSMVLSRRMLSNGVFLTSLFYNMPRIPQSNLRRHTCALLSYNSRTYLPHTVASSFLTYRRLLFIQNHLNHFGIVDYLITI